MKEETAIEWLVRVLELESFENINLYSMNAIEQAKEMEKNQSSICTDQQIIQAKIDGAIMAHTVGYKSAIEYYKNLKNNL